MNFVLLHNSYLYLSSVLKFWLVFWYRCHFMLYLDTFPIRIFVDYLLLYSLLMFGFLYVQLQIKYLYIVYFHFRVLFFAISDSSYLEEKLLTQSSTSFLFIFFLFSTWLLVFWIPFPLPSLTSLKFFKRF